MKTSILTFHRTCNFGAFLQAYALKSALSSLGQEAGFVDYWPAEHAAAYRLFRREEVNSASAFARESFLAACRLGRRLAFRKAERKYLGLGKKVRYTGPSGLSSLDTDCIIYGSDQIWWKDRLHPESGFDPVYWGDCVPSGIRKIAYAPSMGIMDTLTDEDKIFISGRLASFDCLSARESGLAGLIGKLTGREVPVVLDPTLLMPASFWEERSRVIVRDRYVLLYCLGDNKDLVSRAEEISRSTGARLIILKCGTGSYLNMTWRSVTASPFDLVSLVRYADYVVTDSFHGTAFSVMFGKPFEVSGLGRNAGRVTSLLSALGITDTHTGGSGAVTKKLDALRAESLDYLKKALGYGENDIRL